MTTPGADSLTFYSEAFEVLLERLEETRQAAQKAAHARIDQGELTAAEKALQRIKTLSALQSELEDLAERYVEVVGTPETDEGTRLARGLATPQQAYRVPILKALIELGGEADLNLVLERVYAAMKDELNSHDLDTYADGKTVRWRNSAQWARNQLREEGLIRDDTPRGTWAISDKGRAWVEKSCSIS